MAALRLESLPEEVLDMITECFTTAPAGYLSEYHVPPRTATVGTTAERVASYTQGANDLQALCRTNKHFLGLARRHEYENVIITSHSSLFLLFRTVVLVPALADTIKHLECNIPLDVHVAPGFMPALNANPLLPAHWYDGVYNGKPAVGFIRERLALAFMDDWVFNQSRVLQLKNPSAVFFLGILALTSNLQTLTVAYQTPYAIPAFQIQPLVEGRAQMICNASRNNNNNGQRSAPLQKLDTIRFRRFTGESINHIPNDVPEWIACLMKLPQVDKIEITGLVHPQLDPNPNIRVLHNGLRGILTDPQVNNLTRLELVFDTYDISPVKTWLSPILFSMGGTLKHLSLDETMKHDRIDSLPSLRKLEYLEVDLHTLFGWARLWARDDNEILDDYPERANSIFLRDVIPTQSLKTLHLIETFADIDIYLNFGAPNNTTGTGFINGPLAFNNVYAGTDQYGNILLDAARRKALTHGVNDLLLLVQQGGFPALKKFVYTPITHAKSTTDIIYNNTIDKAVQEFAKAGVEMEVVYVGQLGRICH